MIAEQTYELYRRSTLTRAELAALSKIRGRRAAWDTAFLWLQIVLAWWVAARFHESVWVMVAAACVVGNRYYSLFIIGHDGLHRRLHPDVRINDLWADLLLIGPLGAVVRLNRHNHLAHHRGLATSADPDGYKYASRAGSGRGAFLASLTALPFVWRILANVYFHGAGIPSGENQATAASARSPRREKHSLRDLLILCGWQILLIGGLTLTFGWWGYLAMWLLPVYVFTFAADVLRVYCEHSSQAGDEHAQLCDRLITHRSHRAERWLIAPMNMNHHVAHHLWPGIPYYSLPQATSYLESRAAAGLMVFKPSFAGTIRAGLRAAKKSKKDC